ncbi:transposase [Streptomyces sp. NPDC002130]|uniref:transposase n=1 Tax=Streptomyces sp. NPDC002130 TaxID=3155568 RepID=UPI0033307F2E
MPAASRGDDGGKRVPGRKRHIVTDTLGLLLAVAVTAANIGDRDAAGRCRPAPVKNSAPHRRPPASPEGGRGRPAPLPVLDSLEDFESARPGPDVRAFVVPGIFFPATAVRVPACGPTG